jgi:hypothetical protein
VRALRAFRVTAATAGGVPVTALRAPVAICAAFSWASAQGIAPGELAPYWTDPATGALRNDGLSVVSLDEATATRPGQLCFTTTHFTEFVLAAGPVATPTEGQPNHRVLVPVLARAANGLAD